MSKPSYVQKSIERMKVYMELRGLRPNTVYTFTYCARRFLVHVGKPPSAVTTQDVEEFLLDLHRKGRAPEHSRFKRHSSLTESHLQMSDNRSHVNYTRLHTYGIPLYPSSNNAAIGKVMIGSDHPLPLVPDRGGRDPPA